MFDTVLLPIDLTHEESWKKALPMAQKLCGETGTLHLLAIVHDLGAAMVGSFLPKGFEKEAMEKVKTALQDFADKHADGATRSEVHVAHGHVPEAVLRVADQVRADLIVMASHPPEDLGSLLVGSNANRVVRHAKRPVLVVR